MFSASQDCLEETRVERKFQHLLLFKVKAALLSVSSVQHD